MGAYNRQLHQETVQSTEDGDGDAQFCGRSASNSQNMAVEGSIDEADIMPSLPRFIKPLSPSLGTDDLRYLAKRKCFECMSSDLERIVIRRYAEFIHPLIPVLDLDEFVGIVFGDLPQKISLLLYHTVLCAGLAVVEIETIHEYGYESKPSAREELYIKAKALFDMDAEPDRLAASQAAVLLVTWGSNKHSRDAFYWLGIAISLACALKMHRPDGSANLPKTEQSLRRRIWWTIIMKECDICLTLGRPPRVSPYRTALLQQDAFTNNARLTDYSKLPETGKLRRDRWIQQRLDMACMEKAKLSLVIYRILQLPRSSSDYPGNPHRRSARIWQLESELKDWRLQLPVELTSFNPALNLSEDADRSLQMAISILHLTQAMALIMLHKSEVPFATWLESPVPMLGDEWLEDDGAMDARAHIKSMRQAAHEITAIHKALHERGLTPSIPTIGVAAVCTAVFVCLLDARSAQASVRQASLDRLDTCLVVLRELGQINHAATDVTRIVESAVQTARDFPATPAAVTQRTDTAQNPALTTTQQQHELDCTTHSYMEGVLPARHPDKRPNIAGSDTPALFVSAFGSTGQDLFLGMEEFFDFV